MKPTSPPQSNEGPRPPLWVPVAVPLLFLAVSLWLAGRHTLFEEWDGAMQMFGAREIAQGMGYTGWASHYWPPLYALLLLLCSKWTTFFMAGKLISVVSGALLVWVVYLLGVSLSGSARVGVVAQMLLATNQLFLNTAIQIENHTLASLLFAVGVLLALIALRRQTWPWFAALGASVGLAGLARHTNLSLLPAVLLLTCLQLRGRRALLPCLALLVTFALVSAPWFYANYRANGSPLATWQHTNVGLSVIPRAFGITRAQWWWETQSQYHSIRDLITATPVGYVRNALATFRDMARLVLQFLGPMGATGLLGALLLPWLGSLSRGATAPDRRGWLTLWLCAGAYLALVCQAFVYGVVVMPFVGFLALTTALLMQHLVRRPWPQHRRYRYVGVMVALVLLLGANVYASYGNLSTYLRDTEDMGEMIAAEAVGSALREGDAQIASKYVMALNPARAYYSGSRYMCVPLYFRSDDPVALATYRGLTPEVLNWAPRYPFRPMVNRADYLIFDESAKHFLPQYAYLMDPHTKRVPPNWEVRYHEAGVVVWRINW